jgi:proteasome lid subunit RPN8/RPN11
METTHMMDSFHFDPRREFPGRKAKHPEPMDDYRLPASRAEEQPTGPEELPYGQSSIDETTGIDAHPALWVMKISQSAYRETLDYLLARQPEAAGILLGPVQDDPLVTHFVPDSQGTGTAVSFQINATALNRTLKRVRPAGLNCKGLVHSHPAGIVQPSHGDLIYLQKLFVLPANAAAQQCFMPIVCDRRVYPYVYARGRL